MTATNAKLDLQTFTRKTFLRWLREKKEASVGDIYAAFNCPRMSAFFHRTAGALPKKATERAYSFYGQLLTVMPKAVRWLALMEEMERDGAIVVTSDRKWIRPHNACKPS